MNMAVFRIEKTKNYTVMSNHHLKDKSLTLKSKGLLSMILSLPEEWNYTTRGLAAICKEGVDSIGASLRELETAGYLQRNQLRDGKGRITDTEYIIFEFPQTKPDTASPYTENPYMDKPATVLPCTENTAQLNTNESSIKKSNTDLLNIHQSIRAEPPPEAERPQGRKEIDTMDAIDIYREIIKENIDYDNLCEQHKFAADEIDELLELMVETVCTQRKTIRIGGEDKPAEVVKSRLLKLDFTHIEYVMECMSKNTTDVRNIKSYMLTTLFNAPATIGNYYKSRVNHDFYGK